MEQHAIPQQISSYEFKLVGEMTLKQFLKAAAGIVLAILINTTKIVIIIKWPLMILAAGTGLLLAFVPFEDRPLETWIKAFIKSIYSPTIYTYKRKGDHSWLSLNSNNTDRQIQGESVKKEVINKTMIVDEKAEAEEKEKKGRGFFQLISVTAKSKKKKKIVPTTTEVRATPEKKGMVEEKKNEVKVTGDGESKNIIDWRDQKTNLNLQTEKLGATGEAVFGAIPMPDRPEVPNLIVGMATNSLGKIVDGVIVEVQDEHGVPTRVLKTNSLGQFKISTPLANGRYLIIADKEGYTFDRVNVDLTGQIVEPIRIIAHN